MSTVGGSSMALWSANGTYWNTMRSLSLSNDAQPPFLHCIDENPVDGALHGLALIASVGMLDAAQRRGKPCALSSTSG